MALSCASESTLRYLPANRVQCGVYKGQSLAVANESAEPIGNLDGFLVDPAARKVCYAVVHPRGLFTRSRLVPVPGARLDAEREVLLVDGPLSGCEPFDPSRFPEMSDEDIVTAVFAV